MELGVSSKYPLYPVSCKSDSHLKRQIAFIARIHILEMFSTRIAQLRHLVMDIMIQIHCLVESAMEVVQSVLAQKKPTAQNVLEPTPTFSQEDVS